MCARALERGPLTQDKALRGARSCTVSCTAVGVPVGVTRAARR